MEDEEFEVIVVRYNGSSAFQPPISASTLPDADSFVFTGGNSVPINDELELILPSPDDIVVRPSPPENILDFRVTDCIEFHIDLNSGEAWFTDICYA